MDGLEALLAQRRLFIFDLDGTLADTSPVHAAAFSRVLCPRGIDVDYAKIAGLSTEASMRLLIEQSGQFASDEELNALISAKRAAARSGLAQAREIAGAGGFVAHAATRHRLALCTSATRSNAELTLGAIGLGGRFDPVVAADDVARAKPAPDAFLMVLDRTGVAPAEALVFEDSDAGLAAARAAGLDAIRIGEGGTNWASLTAALAGVAA